MFPSRDPRGPYQTLKRTEYTIQIDSIPLASFHAGMGLSFIHMLSSGLTIHHPGVLLFMMLASGR